MDGHIVSDILMESYTSHMM